MLKWLLNRSIGSRNEREVRSLRKRLERINLLEMELQKLADADIQNKTSELRARLAQGESLDDVLVDAFAVVKNVCRRLVGKTWDVVGHSVKWEMVPFDVQLIGGMVLHQGKIAEMATGEGKTLVATLPIYLNALAHQVHVVTVNDYLAQRDCEWMGEVFKFLGLTVSFLRNEMHFDERKRVYACDIVYGTNSEFGFDYLRDNSMATRPEEQVQRGHYFAIVDEVDSILIDEARTPLIISGPSQVSSHRYDQIKPLVQNLFQKQTLLCNRLLKEAKDAIEQKEASDEDVEKASIKLFQVLKGTPKNRQLMKLLEDNQFRKLLDDIELKMMSDLRKKEKFEIYEELYFTIDEKGHDVDLTEMGRQLISPKDTDEFVLPDMVNELHDIDDDSRLTQEEKDVKKEKLQTDYGVRSEKIHNLTQLLRAYSLFEKDVDYVVQDNKVLIVDEFTGRLMPGRRYSDGLHQALEAKEGVKIERETQTFATITIQNYFRMYQKLAGMTGTAETEANEFYQIYKLPVIVIPTNDRIRRKDQHDVIYKTRREKFNAIVDEVAACYEKKRPVLIGTISVDTSEVLSRFFKRRGIAHQVLNARYHQQEAEIVMNAGQPGAVTIATNMAGRGTDIKLGKGVVKHTNCALVAPKSGKEVCPHLKELHCEKEVPCGLHVIGSERHEARRIDRQLRGRCGRQGDPGSSRFYISLEDDLMRLFGSERIARIMDKMGIQEGEQLTNPLLTRSIETAQKRVEQRNFGIRKHTLEFDDVMNKQRQVIYEFRNHVLNADKHRDDIIDIIHEAIEIKIEEYRPAKSQGGDLAGLLKWVDQTFPIKMLSQIEKWEGKGNEELLSSLFQELTKAYEFKEKIEKEHMPRLERLVLLHVIDQLWREHLYNMDSLREGIYLRAYGQKDPLVEYRSEGYHMFTEMMNNMKVEIARDIFRVTLNPELIEAVQRKIATRLVHESLDPMKDDSQRVTVPPEEEEGMERMNQSTKRSALPGTVRREAPKIGRNDPCPCGSGKKFKKCCGLE